MSDVPDDVLAGAIWGHLPGLAGCETEHDEIVAVRLALTEARREVAKPEYDSIRISDGEAVERAGTFTLDQFFVALGRGEVDAGFVAQSANQRLAELGAPGKFTAMFGGVVFTPSGAE